MKRLGLFLAIAIPGLGWSGCATPPLAPALVSNQESPDKSFVRLWLYNDTAGVMAVTLDLGDDRPEVDLTGYRGQLRPGETRGVDLPGGWFRLRLRSLSADGQVTGVERSLRFSDEGRRQVRVGLQSAWERGK